MSLYGLGDEWKKRLVWEKARLASPRDPAEWRVDDYNLLIRYSDYGNRSSLYGWEIDHQVPTTLGGPDNPANWRPLNCRKNASLGGLLGALLRPQSPL